MNLDDFPRVPLAHLPTPLEPMERLSAELGGPRLFVKRDDCTGLGLGGNKTRKLEFLMAEALAAGADSVITAGGVQSNHVRQTAAAAAKLGLAAHLVLTRNVPRTEDGYDRTGNILLDRLLGAEIQILPAGSDRAAAMDARAASLRAAGARPYIIPLGGSNATGALGYAACAQELMAQAEALCGGFDAIVLACSSGGSQGGLIAGLEALGHPARFASQNSWMSVSMSSSRKSSWKSIWSAFSRALRLDPTWRFFIFYRTSSPSRWPTLPPQNPCYLPWFPHARWPAPACPA